MKMIAVFLTAVAGLMIANWVTNGPVLPSPSFIWEGIKNHWQFFTIAVPFFTIIGIIAIVVILDFNKPKNIYWNESKIVGKDEPETGTEKTTTWSRSELNPVSSEITKKENLKPEEVS